MCCSPNRQAMRRRAAKLDQKACSDFSLRPFIQQGRNLMIPNLASLIRAIIAWLSLILKLLRDRERKENLPNEEEPSVFQDYVCQGAF